MPLQSKFFRGDDKLESCLLLDKAHVTQGATGPHVAKIQQALFILDTLMINGTEIYNRYYGPSTATAVLSYKKKRRIINYSYEKTEDNIVGKMTIASLDREMYDYEAALVHREHIGDHTDLRSV
jgi:peptidoglycan hydrolase-like protein with peptidoglycan-binding domain